MTVRGRVTCVPPNCCFIESGESRSPGALNEVLSRYTRFLAIYRRLRSSIVLLPKLNPPIRISRPSRKRLPLPSQYVFKRDSLVRENLPIPKGKLEDYQLIHTSTSIVLESGMHTCR